MTAKRGKVVPVEGRHTGPSIFSESSTPVQHHAEIGLLAAAQQQLLRQWRKSGTLVAPTAEVTVEPLERSGVALL